jgi:hypothetical protein
MQGWIDGLRRFGREGLSLGARYAAPLVEAEVKKTAAAGTSPDGEAWAPRKKDGARPMVNAAAHVSAKAFGPTIRVFLKGADVFHHYATRGEPRRQVIPEGAALPAGIARAIATGCARAFRELVGGTP